MNNDDLHYMMKHKIQNLKIKNSNNITDEGLMHLACVFTLSL